MLCCPSWLSPSLLQHVSRAPFRRRRIPKACLFLCDTSVKEAKRFFTKKNQTKTHLWSPRPTLHLPPSSYLSFFRCTWWQHVSHAIWVSLYTHGLKQSCEIKSGLGITCIYEVFSGLCLTCHSLHRWKDIKDKIWTLYTENIDYVVCSLPRLNTKVFFKFYLYLMFFF